MALTTDLFTALQAHKPKRKGAVLAAEAGQARLRLRPRVLSAQESKALEAVAAIASEARSGARTRRREEEESE